MWSEADRAFIARVREFPALEAHGDSRGGSIRALMSVVDAVVRDLAESGAEIPTQAGKEKGEKK